jgi:GDP-L-fucose synthase
MSNLFVPGKNSKIYIAGHRGLVGSALLKRLREKGYKNIIVRTRQELDLREQDAVRRFFSTERPEFVLLAAAKVGGIHANSTYPAQFAQQNLAIQTNVIHEAWRHSVKQLLFLGSSCIYPKDCPQPMKEEHLLSGPLEPTNRPYALAKISGIEMCWSYNRQYGTRYLAVMPTNLYGPNDNYHPKNSHVLPALIRKVLEAKSRGDSEISVWGSGKPRREFLYSEDVADACLHLLEQPQEKLNFLFNDDRPPLVNIGSGKDISIRELAELIMDITGFDGKIVFDAAMPDGPMQKLLDTRLLDQLGWQASTSLRDGIAHVCASWGNAERT